MDAYPETPGPIALPLQCNKDRPESRRRPAGGVGPQGTLPFASCGRLEMPTNHKPHAVADFAASQGGEAVTIDAVANDKDRDGEALTLSAIGRTPHHGILTILDGSLLYTPDADWHGKDSFTYRVDDGHGGTAHGKVAVTVTDGSHAAGGWRRGPDLHEHSGRRPLDRDERQRYLQPAPGFGGPRTVARPG